MTPMNLRTRSDDLEVLLAVAEFGGFSAAANALDMQVARVSRSVSKVEEQLGAAIFTRTTRQVRLTDEGYAFVESVKQGLEHIQLAENAIIQVGELPKGKLRVDAASPFLLHQVVPLINGFKKAFPDIELELTSSEEFVDLIEKRTDIAIRIGKLEDSSLKARALGKSPLCIVASPQYLSQHKPITKPNDLNNHQTIGFSTIKQLNKWPLKGLPTYLPSIAASSGETIRQLALSGNGIACLSSFMIKDDINQGRLVKLLQPYVKSSELDRELVNAVYYPSSTIAKRINAFLDYIKPRLKLV
ncbi:LysR family transcriptional regulator [Psychrosphaera aestuarii]